MNELFLFVKVFNSFGNAYHDGLAIILAEFANVLVQTAIFAIVSYYYKLVLFIEVEELSSP